MPLDADEKRQATATTLFVGLWDAALRFRRTLPKAERKDWEKLAEELWTCFPEQEQGDRIQDAIMKLSEPRQGQKGLREYIDEVQELTIAIPDEWDQTEYQRFRGRAQRQSNCLAHGLIRVPCLDCEPPRFMGCGYAS